MIDDLLIALIEQKAKLSKWEGMSDEERRLVTERNNTVADCIAIIRNHTPAGREGDVAYLGVEAFTPEQKMAYTVGYQHGVADTKQAAMSPVAGDAIIEAAKELIAEWDRIKYADDMSSRNIEKLREALATFPKPVAGDAETAVVRMREYTRNQKWLSEAPLTDIEAIMRLALRAAVDSGYFATVPKPVSLTQVAQRAGLIGPLCATVLDAAGVKYVD